MLERFPKRNDLQVGRKKVRLLDVHQDELDFDGRNVCIEKMCQRTTVFVVRVFPRLCVRLNNL